MDLENLVSAMDLGVIVRFKDHDLEYLIDLLDLNTDEVIMSVSAISIADAFILIGNKIKEIK